MDPDHGQLVARSGDFLTALLVLPVGYGYLRERGIYRLEFEPDPMNEPATFRRLPGDWGAKTEFPEGVEVAVEGAEVDESTSEDYLEFSPDGTAPGARVVLSHESGDVVTLEVDPADGRTRVVEEEK